jgi:hypothetical protein
VLDQHDREHDAAQLSGDLPADTTGPAGWIRGHAIHLLGFVRAFNLAQGYPSSLKNKHEFRC